MTKGIMLHRLNGFTVLRPSPSSSTAFSVLASSSCFRCFTSVDCPVENYETSRPACCDSSQQQSTAIGIAELSLNHAAHGPFFADFDLISLLFPTSIGTLTEHLRLPSELELQYVKYSKAMALHYDVN